MDQDVIATHLENLDRRLGRVEQILPTLATKEELREEGERLRSHMDEVEERSRRHMDVLAESLRSDIQLIAEHVAAEMSKRAGS